jgi:hypothetical protein
MIRGGREREGERGRCEGGLLALTRVRGTRTTELWPWAQKCTPASLPDARQRIWIRLLRLSGKRKGPELVEHEGTVRAYDQWGRNAVPRVCDMLGVPGVDKVGFGVWHSSHFSHKMKSAGKISGFSGMVFHIF